MTDRRGKTTYYDRDELGRVTKIIDPLNHTTQYTYCGCGGPETITDGRNKVTTIAYNNAGWKTSVTYADNTYENFYYDAFGRMTNRSDSLGTRAYGYNNQGLLIGITNSYGTERWSLFNIHDQPITNIDANGVSVVLSLDRLGRQLSRAVLGQGTEYFEYTARGLTNYTGPDAKVTRYALDAALRKTSETTPKSETITYAYSPAGDLRTLTDGRNKTTVWTNDIEGLVRGKQYHGQTFTNIVYAYDVGLRLTSRTFWLSGSTSRQTSYTYDDAGNLTYINYPNSPDVTFTYNEVNRIATMYTPGLGHQHLHVLRCREAEDRIRAMDLRWRDQHIPFHSPWLANRPGRCPALQLLEPDFWVRFGGPSLHSRQSCRNLHLHLQRPRHSLDESRPADHVRLRHHQRLRFGRAAAANVHAQRHWHDAQQPHLPL